MGKKVKRSSQSKRSRGGSGGNGEPKPGACAQQFLANMEPVSKQAKKGLVVQRRPALQQRDMDGLEFEDPVGDEFEEEYVVHEDEDGDAAMMDADQAAEEDADAGGRKVWNPKKHGPLKDDEKLDFDSSAYAAYYSLRVEWPCLSFDVVRDRLGNFRSRFPLEFTVATGTQAARADDNRVHLWKVENLCCTRKDGMSDDDDDDGDDDDEDEDDNDENAVIEARSFRHPGGVNRLRSCPQRPEVLATWADTGKVHMWDAGAHLQALSSAPSTLLSEELAPLHTFGGHATEGFAMDWSGVVAGRFVTGDCLKFVYVWQAREGGFAVDATPYKGHKASVEDLQWSPSEAGVFASCSVDRSIRIWDTRTHARSMLAVDDAHPADVNVLSWNASVPHLLASGGDDGAFKVWDLRAFRRSELAGFFQWHERAITSVRWHPSQDAVLAVASEDDSVSVWDMSVEQDQDEQARGADLDGLDVPPQLLFVHRGQQQIKEIQFHPQIPSLLVSTAADGFNFFKPDNV